MSIFEDELKRLNFEDWIFIILIFSSITNIFGNKIQKEYVKRNDKKYMRLSNEVYLIALVISLFVYLYFTTRNYYFYKKANEITKNLFSTKLLGTIFLVIGILFLIYFQLKDPNFIGAPA